MRIVFLIKALGAGQGGGAERVLVTIASALGARGHEVSIVSFDPPASEDFYEVSERVRRIRLGIGETTARSGPRVTLVRLKQIRRTLKELDPDVAVGFMHSAFIPLALALAGTGTPVIGSERTSFSHYRRHPLSRFLLRASLPFVTAFTVNNTGVRSGFPDSIASRMRVIHNPVSPASALADPMGGAAKTLLSVGGLRPEKDHATLLSAFARIADKFGDWHLRIVGQGSLSDRLQRQAHALGIGERVEFAGASSAVETEYRRAQLFVLTSIYEAFPNCLAEALAHGLPAIGFSDCPGTNELILPGRNGILAHGSNRIEALAAALEELMSSPQRRLELGRAAPATVAQFSLDRVAGEWEDLLGSVSRGRPN